MDPLLNSARSLRARFALFAGLALFAAATAAEPARAAGADPMRPWRAPDAAPVVSETKAAATAETGARLVAVRVDAGDRRRALVGDRWLQAGDTVDGWRVAEIGADAVRLSRGPERRVLHLWAPPAEPLPAR